MSANQHWSCNVLRRTCDVCGKYRSYCLTHRETTEINACLCDYSNPVPVPVKTERELALEAQVAALKKQLADEREARRREDETVRNLLNDVLADIERGSR